MKKSIILYGALVVTISCVLFFLPINLFDGEVHYKYGVYDYTVKENLSLSYFLGIGANPSQTNGVVDFYLLPIGYLLAFMVIFVLPAILTYRIKLKKKRN